MLVIVLVKRHMEGETLKSDLHKDYPLDMVAQETPQQFYQGTGDKLERQVCSETQQLQSKAKWDIVRWTTMQTLAVLVPTLFLSISQEKFAMWHHS